MSYQSTKVIELGSCAFRQWKADHSHCHYIHGYRLIAKFWFSCEELDNKNWVVDFGGLKGLKQILEKQFDHTFCVAADDPLISYFRQLHDLGAVDLRIMDKGVGIERTAEWCFEQADKHVRQITNNRCCVDKVEVWEHEKNSAIYSVQKGGCCKDKLKHNAQAVADVKNAEAINQSLTQLANVVAAPAPEIQEAVSTTIQPNITVEHTTRGASVGNNTTTGWGDMFKGTTWG